MAPKSWMLTNSTNYAADGKLFLGQVLHDPLNPESALITGKPRKLPDTLHVDTTYATNPVITSQELLEHSGGFWLQAHGLNCGVSANAGSLGTSNVKWEVKRLVGKITTFSMEYLTTVLAEQDVTNFVKRSLVPFPTLFIITGVRIFEGAKLVEDTAENMSAIQGQLQADGAPKVPLQAGLGGQRIHAQKRGQAFDSTSSFVFAYQCNKINSIPWRRMAPYSKGQTESAGTSSNDARVLDEVLGIKPHPTNPIKLVEFGSGNEADDLQEQETAMLYPVVAGETTEVVVRYIPCQT